MQNELLNKIVNQFQIEGEVLSIEPYGEGHINNTFLVTTEKKRYILQRINTNVFPDTESLMGNISAVTKYLENKGIETLHIINAKDGKTYYSGEGCWRIYDFIENTVSYQIATDKEMFKSAGYAFGEFMNNLSGFDASVLTETIKNFQIRPRDIKLSKRLWKRISWAGRKIASKRSISF